MTGRGGGEAADGRGGRWIGPFTTEEAKPFLLRGLQSRLCAAAKCGAMIETDAMQD
jgi:hypothetical protein